VAWSYQMLRKPARFAVDMLFDPNIEGGFTDDVYDSGGPTKYGISQRWYPHLDIENLTRDYAQDLYAQDYIHKFDLEQLPAALCVMAIDMVVNQGSSRLKLLQRSLRVIEDGIIGPMTIARAVAVCADSDYSRDLLISDFLSRRTKKYAEHPEWERYGRGWSRRLFFMLQRTRSEFF